MSELDKWRRYLRRDPTRFLLDGPVDPSIHLAYLLDVARRPEESIAVTEAREHVLYSSPVQEILAAQTAEGGWPPLDSLAAPRYRATIWNLALLVELGLARNSRRARGACEFVLGKLDPEKGWPGLDAVEAGYLVHALAYFGQDGDARVLRAARILLERAGDDRVAGQVRVAALWGVRELQSRMDRSELERVVLRVCDSLPLLTEFGPITHPSFDPSDPLFILRAVTAYELPDRDCISRLVDFVVAKQDEEGRWPLEKSLNGSLLARVEEESAAGRWATLNAIRVIVRLVVGED